MTGPQPLCRCSRRGHGYSPAGAPREWTSIAESKLKHTPAPALYEVQDGALCELTAPCTVCCSCWVSTHQPGACTAADLTLQWKYSRAWLLLCRCWGKSGVVPHSCSPLRGLARHQLLTTAYLGLICGMSHLNGFQITPLKLMMNALMGT